MKYDFADVPECTTPGTHKWFRFDTQPGTCQCETCGADSFDPLVVETAEVRIAPEISWSRGSKIETTEPTEPANTAPHIRGPTTRK